MCARFALQQDGCTYSLILHAGVYEDFQVLACMGVGADYMAPYLGRMMDLWKPNPAMFSEVRRREGEGESGP
jgi:transaldolase